MSTIKEIARRANVSIGTVDRVIHGRGRVSSETGERVRRIVEEIGYKPNIFAKHLRLGRTFTFGVVMPKPIQDGLYWALPAAGVVRADRELKLQRVDVRFFYYDKFSAASVTRVRQEVMRSGLDGLLIAPVLSRVFEEFLAELPPGCPTFYSIRSFPRPSTCPYIGQDAYQSGVLSARLMHLLVPAPGPLAVLRASARGLPHRRPGSGFRRYGRHAGVKHRVEVFEINTHAGAKARNRIFSRIVGSGGLAACSSQTPARIRLPNYLRSDDPTGAFP